MARPKTVKEKVESNIPYQQVLNETLKEINKMKQTEEANIVACCWKNCKILQEYREEIENLKFPNNDIIGAYYNIAYGIVITEGKTIDEINVGNYLKQHNKLEEVYVKSGGFDGIYKHIITIEENDIEAYIKNYRKWSIIETLAQNGYPITNRIPEFKDRSLESIYHEYDANLNRLFSNEDFDIHPYDISEGILNTIDKLDAGHANGLPFYEMPLLNKNTGGLLMGDITLIGGVSNSGKSTFLRLTLLPSIINKNEKIVIFLNEEGIEKWQKEMILWVANNVYKYDIPKWKLNQGNYDEETKRQLIEAANWIESKKINRNITLIPLETYRTSTVVKTIRRYADMGYKYFAIDTFKLDNSDGYEVRDTARLQLVQNMTNLYNTIKESNKNVHLICTIQLNKGSTRTRFIALDNIGESKNIVDPCANAIFIRNILSDEYEGPHALIVKRNAGVNNESTVTVTLDKDKKYQIIFIGKSREAAAGVGSHQIVVEVDFSKNIIKEVGWTDVPIDFQSR